MTAAMRSIVGSATVATPSSSPARTRHRDWEKHKAYKRAEYRSVSPGAHKGDFVSTDAALYDPRRDAPLHHADLTAALMGYPPIGRRAIDARTLP